MRNLNQLDKHRVPIPEVIGGGMGDDTNGCFVLHRAGVELRVIASAGGGWDHVSVHAAAGYNRTKRIPTWEEMEFVKRTFFKRDEVAMQLHVPAADHINCNPYTLHLWRPHHARIPLPPKEYV
jgi:hypothetical protein